MLIHRFLRFQLGFYVLSYIFILLEWRQLVSGLCVASAGFVFGALFAWMARLNRAQIIAVSMETALQNGNIAFILLKVSLPTPYSDIAALPSIAQILMCTAILYVMYTVVSIHKYCVSSKCRGDADAEDPAETDASLMNGRRSRSMRTSPVKTER